MPRVPPVTRAVLPCRDHLPGAPAVAEVAAAAISLVPAGVFGALTYFCSFTNQDEQSCSLVHDWSCRHWYSVLSRTRSQLIVLRIALMLWHNFSLV
jgi:hypothetical protein